MLRKKTKRLLNQLDNYFQLIKIPTDDEEINSDLGLKADYLIEENLEYSLNEYYIETNDIEENFDLFDYAQTLQQISTCLIFSNTTNIYISYKLEQNSISDIKELMQMLITCFENTSELKRKLQNIRGRVNHDFSNTNSNFNLLTSKNVNQLIDYLQKIKYKIAETIEYCENLSGIDPQINKTNYNNININLIWFQVGLLFANGEIENLIQKHQYNFTQMAKEKFKTNYTSYRPYISETYNNNSKNNKNIWNSNSKIITIYNYCIDNTIEMTTEFLNHYHAIIYDID
ncbi:hypothetical protein SAMN04488007_3662 [Maribacter aquivivus]|uniref:Uncharacterized protein n=1 Tax=Maribacter aquivivus TaxID=228958 RepID=A0A1M6USC3_9FLAO|nr:hypothetical protein [Maribacter aquivivus]SHK72115.1 hypothetical protein SAMN04488007_3662 [Maribacter aquivivus]